jgi:Nif-specific regulatory protein
MDHVAPYRARLRLGDFTGRSLALANVLQKVEVAAGSDAPIFFKGVGSGCGKTMLAHIIHDSSARRDQPFVQVDCAAIPKTLCERELVGSTELADERASETTGRVGLARGGTLYLREVSCLSPSAQSRLLRLLQTGAFSPIGSSRERPADVRVIATTSGDALEEVARGWLSEPLFLQLNDATIVVPPLEERREDIVPLAQYLCRRAQQSAGTKALELSPEALEALEASYWPGHARQVEHMVEAGAIRASNAGAPSILATHVFPPLRPEDRKPIAPR